MDDSLDVQLDGKPSEQLYEQQIHDLRKQLGVLQMMEKEYITEIEILQKKYEVDIETEKVKLKAQEDKSMLMESELLSKIELLERDKKADCEYYQRLNGELEEKVKKLEEQVKQLTDSNNKEQLHQLQTENKELKKRLSDLCSEYLQLQEKITAGSRREEELQNDLCEFRELYSAQKEELKSNEDAAMRLRDEKALLKSELDILKSKPQDENKKGNSLFAEVDDKRQSMKKNLENALLKYRKLKKLYMEKCADASRFREEYIFLTRKCEDIETALKTEDEQLISSYKDRIKLLEEENEILKKAKSPYIFPTDEKAAFKSMENFLQSYRKEAEKLKSDLEDESMKVLFTKQTLHNVQRELHQSELECIRARQQIIELQGLLQEKQEKSDDEIQQTASS